ncbi:Uncharacterised protein [Ectopseudomonas mendocina]|uniref:Uncharacterized protein n=1 Tax=Ectopseudomonas mendocina TaxID=300 RepID=A0A379PP58_ECTME|nr:hypothetical protein [Pseudomonas mendocina]SUE95859.1 Uncharacterised protein [Pseudomonas mendocina]
MQAHPAFEIKKENDTVEALCMELTSPGLIHTRMALDPEMSPKFLSAVRDVMHHFVNMITSNNASPEEFEKLHKELAEKHASLNYLCREFLIHQIARLGGLLIKEENRRFYELPKRPEGEVGKGPFMGEVQFNDQLAVLMERVAEMAGGQAQFAEIQRECLEEVRAAGLPSFQDYDRKTAEFVTGLCSAISKVIVTKTCDDPRRTELGLNGMLELIIAARDIATMPTVLVNKPGEEIFMDRVSIVIQETLEAKVFAATPETIDQVIGEIKKSAGAPAGATIH